MKSALWIALSAGVLLAAGAASGGDRGLDGSAGEAERLEVGTGFTTGAADAVAVVDSFSQAMSRGDLEAAGQHLDPTVLILEHGASERTAAEYLEGHGKADARFLRGARQKMIHRETGASGDLAWVVTERAIEGRSDSKTLSLYSTETMVLRRAPSGRWRIVHIHWSSRRTTPDSSH